MTRKAAARIGWRQIFFLPVWPGRMGLPTREGRG